MLLKTLISCLCCSWIIIATNWFRYVNCIRCNFWLPLILFCLFIYLTTILVCSRLFYQLELFLSSGTVCLSVYSLVAAMFGMNIPYPWNEGHGYIFKWVSQHLGYFASHTRVCVLEPLPFAGSYLNQHCDSLHLHVNNDLFQEKRSHWILIMSTTHVKNLSRYNQFIAHRTSCNQLRISVVSF